MNIKIIYGTLAGTTKYVAEIIQKRLNKLGHKTDLHNINDNSKPIIDNYDLLIFGSPTYENGELEYNMSHFLSQFSPNLSKYNVAVFGLGSSNYPKFCRSAALLEHWVVKNSGKLTVPSLKIDGYPQDLKLINNWVRKLLEKIISKTT